MGNAESGHAGPQKYENIGDEFNSLQKVRAALKKNGLESCSLIIGIDYTKSNEWTGEKSYGGKSLHTIGSSPNPYEQAIHIIGNTLPGLDEDQLIPCFGFGDVTTHDRHVFHFNADGRPCRGLEESLLRYRQVTPHVHLSGPTSFAPIIEAAVRQVEESGGLYHVLLIIADGQVTRVDDLPRGQYSPQEQATMEALVAASNYALSIVLVGCGDGPWGDMKHFDDHVQGRNFDNFQFVDFSAIMAGNESVEKKGIKFALSALMEIPSQFKACVQKGYVGNMKGLMPPTPPLPPPPSVLAADKR